MSQFEEFEQRPTACAVCEAMLPEAVDGILSEAEQRAFDRHVAGCVECARELAEARRGAAWLSMLKSQAPEPPAGLLAKILAETTGSAPHDALATPAPPLPPGNPCRPGSLRSCRRPVSRPGFTGQWTALRQFLSNLVPAETSRVIFQPRFAMTAAMAFFSIALTLNLTGVRLRDLRASNFTPSALKRTVADLDASATRTFQNNREVYQVESRLNEMRNDDENNVSPAGQR